MSPDAPDPSPWLDAATYDYLDRLIPSDLAWECLRRNRRYHEDFHRAAAEQAAPLGTNDAIAARWGLRFPGSARSLRPAGAHPLDA